MILDVCFSVHSINRIPLDHGYPLYGALSRIVPIIHGHPQVGIHPIRGIADGRGYLTLDGGSSTLTLRVADELTRDVIKLAGKRIDINGGKVQIGVPSIYALAPHPSLRSRLVTIKGYTEEETFRAGLRAKLEDKELNLLNIPETEIGQRRVFRVHGQTLVGFTVKLFGLSDEDSTKLQEKGLGGRRHLGCGIFTPIDDKPTTTPTKGNSQ
jgi:CRISPR-associated protein Cas6